MAGLTTAVALVRHGLKVLLVESGDTLGGRARSWTDETTGDRVDLGPHILASQYRNMLRLLEILGTEQQVVWQRRPHLILVDKPEPVVMRLRPLPAPLQFAPSLMSVPQVSWADLISNYRIMWQVLRLDEQEILALDRTDAESHLREMGVSKRALDWFWRSASMTIMNTPLELCSAGALLRFIRYLAGRNDYRVGFAGEGLGDLFAPAAAQQVQDAGSQVLMETAIREWVLEGERAAGAVLGDGSSVKARFCVSAMPPGALHASLPAALLARHPVFAALDRFEPSPYICTYLWFDRKLSGEAFWTKVWSPDNLNYDFYDLSNIQPHLAGKPSVIAANCMHSLKSQTLTDAEIIQRTQAEVAEYLPEAAQANISHARVHRVPMGIVRPSPGSENLRPDTTTPVSGFFLAGDWVNTGLPGSMESAARSGWMAAEQVLAALGRPVELAEPLPKLTGLAALLGKRQGHG